MAELRPEPGGVTGTWMGWDATAWFVAGLGEVWAQDREPPALRPPSPALRVPRTLLPPRATLSDPQTPHAAAVVHRPVFPMKEASRVSGGVIHRVDFWISGLMEFMTRSDQSLTSGNRPQRKTF